MPPTPGPRYEALLELLRTADTVWQTSRVFFARWDLSPSQFNLLNLLADQAAGRSQSELSRALIMHRSNATGLVDRLEQRGLVRRTESAQDRRAWRVVLTPAGRRLLARILPRYHEAAEAVGDFIEAAEARALIHTLRQLGDRARQLAPRYARSRA